MSKETNNLETSLETQAKELMQKFNVKSVYRSSNGLWFTKKEKAEQYATENKLQFSEYKFKKS